MLIVALGGFSCLGRKISLLLSSNAKMNVPVSKRISEYN